MQCCMHVTCPPYGGRSRNPPPHYCCAPPTTAYHLQLAFLLLHHISQSPHISHPHLAPLTSPHPSLSLHIPLTSHPLPSLSLTSLSPALPPQEITQDGAVRVSITKVYQPGQLSVVFYLTSMRQTPQDLVVSFMLPSSCQCSLDGASVPSSTSTDVTLAPFGTVSEYGSEWVGECEGVSEWVGECEGGRE